MKKDDIPANIQIKEYDNRAPNFPKEFWVLISESVNTEYHVLLLTTEKSSFQLKKHDVNEMKQYNEKRINKKQKTF